MENKIKATPNHAKRTFTIRKYDKEIVYSKYRTFPMTKEEFNSCLHHTENDWKHWLQSDEFTIIN